MSVKAGLKTPVNTKELQLAHFRLDRGVEHIKVEHGSYDIPLDSGIFKSFARNHSLLNKGFGFFHIFLIA